MTLFCMAREALVALLVYNTLIKYHAYEYSQINMSISAQVSRAPTCIELNLECCNISQSGLHFDD